MPCEFCGKVIWVDMYRHMARLHLDLVQLWRCPIAWCTTWKGSPALRSMHRRGLCVESCGRIRYEWSIPVSPLTYCYYIHYRVYRGGLPHAVFRTDYIERLRSLLQSSGQPASPPETGRGSTPKSAKRLHRSSRLRWTMGRF